LAPIIAILIRPIDSHSEAWETFLMGLLMEWCLGKRLCLLTGSFWILLLTMERFNVFSHHSCCKLTSVSPTKSRPLSRVAVTFYTRQQVLL